MSTIKRPRFGGVFLFVLLQYSPIQASTARFVPSMQLSHPRHKIARKALQALFLRLHPLNRPRYQTDTSGYNTTCATLERLPAPGRPAQIPDTDTTPDAVQTSTDRPIIIRYIRVRPCYGSMPDSATYRKPCQPGGVISYRVRIAGKCYTQRTC